MTEPKDFALSDKDTSEVEITQEGNTDETPDVHSIFDVTLGAEITSPSQE